MSQGLRIPFVDFVGIELLACDAGRAELAVTLRDELIPFRVRNSHNKP